MNVGVTSSWTGWTTCPGSACRTGRSCRAGRSRWACRTSSPLSTGHAHPLIEGVAGSVDKSNFKPDRGFGSRWQGNTLLVVSSRSCSPCNRTRRSVVAHSNPEPLVTNWGARRYGKCRSGSLSGQFEDVCGVGIRRRSGQRTGGCDSGHTDSPGWTCRTSRTCGSCGSCYGRSGSGGTSGAGWSGGSRWPRHSRCSASATGRAGWSCWTCRTCHGRCCTDIAGTAKTNTARFRVRW